MQNNGPSKPPNATVGVHAAGLACERSERLLYRQCDLKLAPGTLLHLRGPNGAGKTTFLKTLAGLMPLQSGVVSYRHRSDSEPTMLGSEGRHVDWSLAELKCCYIGHRSGIKALLTPLENLRFWLRLNYSSGSFPDEQDELLAALDWAGLGDCADLRCGQLSAGQQRRVALARLRVSDAAVCLLDEPFTALDDGGVKLVEAQLEQMAARGQIVMLTSHTQPTLKDLYSLDLQQNGLVFV